MTCSMDPTRSDRPSPLIVVFAPSPQLTITVERLADNGDEVHVHAGGQGVWIARMAETLGARVRLCGAFGGEGGPILKGLLRDEGIDVVATDVAGANPVYVHDRRSGERREVAAQAPGTLGRHEADDLYGRTLATASEADVVVIGGPVGEAEVPVSFYSRLTSDLRTLGPPVVADLSGETMRAALDGGVDVLKVSHEDLLRDGDADGDGDDALIAAMHRLAQRGAAAVIVTRGADPSLVLADGRVHHVEAPRLSAVDHRGAGDALSAGIAVALASGADLMDAIRLGTAAGSSTVARHGLASAQAELVATLAARVQIHPHPEEA